MVLVSVLVLVSVRRVADVAVFRPSKYIRVRVCVYIYYVCFYVCVCVCVCVYVCVFVYVCVCVCISIHINAYIYMHIYTHHTCEPGAPNMHEKSDFSYRYMQHIWTYMGHVHRHICTYAGHTCEPGAPNMSGAISATGHL